MLARQQSPLKRPTPSNEGPSPSTSLKVEPSRSSMLPILIKRLMSTRAAKSCENHAT